MIPFRTQRMASSVVNRILDVYEGIAPAASSGAPAAPGIVTEGAELTAKLAEPKPAVDAEPAAAAAIALGPLAK